MNRSTAFLLALLAVASGVACGGAADTAGGNAQGTDVVVTPDPARVAPSGTQQFAAAVTGTANTSVTWTIREAPAGGAIGSTGLYTAPSTTGTFHVRATSVADPTVYGEAVVTVSSAPPSTGVSGLHVVGNQIRNSANQEVRIHGVNHDGSEYACVQGWGFFDGPSDAASIAAIKSWKANAIRVPLNEECWLGINGVAAAYGGANYQNAIAGYVSRITAAGMITILELHWAAPGSQAATGQVAMPNRDHTPTFWGQVANAFKGNSSVVFELYNEPYPDGNQNTTAAWTCWRDGGTCPGLSYTAAGMQELVNAVRSTGATNVILLGGIQYANTLYQWLTYKPTDATGNLAASWHVYNFNICASSACYDANAGSIIGSVPVVATEIGQDDCQGGFVTTLMNWLDARGGGYVPWTWNTWGSCLSLISNYDGTATTPYGQTYRNHLATLP